jgi:hypothetical protein
MRRISSFTDDHLKEVSNGLVVLNLLDFKFRLKTNFYITFPVTIFVKFLSYECVFNHAFFYHKILREYKFYLNYISNHFY